MPEIAHLLRLIDAYKRAVEIEDVTLSHRLFGDSKKIQALRHGADITVTRYCGAMVWLASNWPDKAIWPEDIPQPEGVG